MAVNCVAQSGAVGIGPTLKKNIDAEKDIGPDR
jgi:hypothetical protein